MSLSARLLHLLVPTGVSDRASPLWPEVVRLRRAVLPVAGLGVLASLLEGAGIGLLIPLVALMFGGVGTEALPAALRPLVERLPQLAPDARILAIGGAAIALVALKGVVQTLHRWFVGAIGNRASHRLRMILARQILDLDYPQFLAHDNVRLVNAIATASWDVAKIVHQACAIIAALASLAVFGVLLLWLDWRLALVVAAGVGLTGILLWWLERRMDRLGKQLAARNILLGERMLMIVSAIRPIRVFGQRDSELARFEDASASVRDAITGIDRATAPLLPLVEGLVAVLFVAILLVAYRLAVPAAVLTAFLILLLRAQSHAQEIGESRLGIAAQRGAIDELEWLLSLETEQAWAAAGGTIAAIDAPVRFKDVSYTYPDGSRGLSGASFAIQPGSITALIGRSGSGKSTVVNLLCGLLAPQSGAIMVGEQRLETIARADWGARIALAGQDVELVDGTIADNIAYGVAGAVDDHAVLEAARAADADSFIASLPLGYETRINLENVGLSGGQRQRIGLARALLRRADLLILDEATNSVDGLSEGAILRLLTERRWFRTALVISHRRSTLAACDQGIVLVDGRVGESGPLPDLAYFAIMRAEYGD